MKTFFKKSLLAMFIISNVINIISCNNTSTQNTDDVLPEQKDTFENMSVNISTNAASVILDSSIIITTSCLPKFNGRGKVILFGDGMLDSSVYEIHSPIQKLAIKNSNSTSSTELLVDFIADEQLIVDWEIILKTQTSYSFSAKTIFDSIFVSDSSDLFNYDYETIKDQGYIYQNLYANSFPLVLEHP